MKLISRLGSIRVVIAAGVLAGLAACTAGPTDPDALIADPYQETNRDVHAFNKGLDTAILKPVSEAYGVVVPDLVKHLVKNEIQHLKLPGVFVNRILQGDSRMAGRALGRFTLNTTLGAGGLLDPATEFGLPYEPTDFAVTLAAWGAGEGVYHEAPLFGPSTTRHVVGRFINFAIDPTVLVTAGVVELGTALTIADTARTPVDIVNARHDNADIIDSVLYESDDSYVTARAGYIQNRRRLVSGETDTDQLPDLFD